MALEALRGSHTPFDARIHSLRRQPGQMASAAHLRALLKGSEIAASHRTDDPRVQDPYTLRCIPQVLGAMRDTIAHCARVVEARAWRGDRQPAVLPRRGASSPAATSTASPWPWRSTSWPWPWPSLAAFSERRTYLLLDDREAAQDRLPAFLAREPGLNSGYMIAQYAAAALVAENAVLATPAGLHSIPTSRGDGGLRQHGGDGGDQATHGAAQRPAGCGDRAALRVGGGGVSPAFTRGDWG